MRAANQGVHVEVTVDEKQFIEGPSKFMRQRCQEMRGAGVIVRTARGKPLGPHYAEEDASIGGTGRVVAGVGSCHAKTFLGGSDGRHCICGSTNWTTAARGNHEISCHLHLTKEGAKELFEIMQAIHASGSPLAETERRSAEQCAASAYSGAPRSSRTSEVASSGSSSRPAAARVTPAAVASVARGATPTDKTLPLTEDC